MTNEMRSNIYKIVDNTRTPEDSDQAPPSRKPTSAERVKPYLKSYARGLRWFVYYALLWIRPLAQLLAKVIGIPAMIVAGIGFLIGDEKRSHIPWLMLGVSFGAFLFGWFYDSLLLKVAPEPVTLL